MDVPIHSQVLGVNEAYYDAFARRDLIDLMACWSPQPDIVCIGPLYAPEFGRERVEHVYRVSFDVTAGHEIDVEVLHAIIGEPLATVTCRELLRLDGPEVVVTEMLATNVFRLEDAGWRMIHHHASWRASTRTSRLGDRDQHPD